jgi:hypothetical protein
MGLTVGPLVRTKLATNLRSCRALSAGGRHRAATECLRSVLNNIQTNDPRWLKVFLLGLVAQSLEQQQHWKEANRAYRKSVSESRQLGKENTAIALETWSRAEYLRGSLHAAEEHCIQALTLRESQAPNSLSVAPVSRKF